MTSRLPSVTSRLLSVTLQLLSVTSQLPFVTSQLPPPTAKGCSVAEPLWAQSFWDRGAERTRCFQGSAIAEWRGERLRKQGAQGRLRAAQGAGLWARASRSPLGTHQCRGKGTRRVEPAGGIGLGASTHTALGGPGSGAAGGSLWLDPAGGRGWVVLRDGSGWQPGRQSRMELCCLRQGTATASLESPL